MRIKLDSWSIAIYKSLAVLVSCKRCLLRLWEHIFCHFMMKHNNYVSMGSFESSSSAPRYIGEILNEYLLHSNASLAAAYRKHVQEMMASNESVDYIKKGERYD